MKNEKHAESGLRILVTSLNDAGVRDVEINKDAFLELHRELREDFNAIYTGIRNIKNKLQKHSDGKTLKGDEIVGGLQVQNIDARFAKTKKNFC